MEPKGETSGVTGIVVGGVGADRLVSVPELGSTTAGVPDGVPTGRSSHASFVAPAPADTAENGAGSSARAGTVLRGATEGDRSLKSTVV
jgi:hypothetical protein